MTGTDKNSSLENKQSKVARLIAEYDLEGIGEEMEELWTRTDDTGLSTRELADHFNKELLRAVLHDAGMEVIQSELTAIQSFVNGEQQTVREEIEVEERLARHDIDPDKLNSLFVSHQTVYNYLTEQRGAEYQNDTGPEERIRKSSDSIQKMKARTTSVAKNILDSLARAGLITLGEYDVISEVSVYCEDCGSRFTTSELIARRGCNCDG